MAALNRQRWWRRVFLLAVVLVCTAPACTPDGPAGETASAPGEDTSDGPAFELVAFTPWMAGGLEDNVVSASSMLIPGRPQWLLREVPTLLLGPDGTLWLVSRRVRRAVRFTGPDEGEVVPLDRARLDTIGALAATADGGLLLFGKNGEAAALARLSGAGELVWRTTDLLPIRGTCWTSRLLIDGDGSFYLYAAVHPDEEMGRGEVVRVELEDGALDGVVAFGSAPPGEMWVQEGGLYWVEYADGLYSWVRHEIDTGERRAVGLEAVMETSMDDVEAVLPAGGILLDSYTKDALVWASPDGIETGQLERRGIMRAGDGVATALWEGRTLTLTWWKDGERSGVVEVSDPFWKSVICADEDEFYLWGGEPNSTIHAVDVQGEWRPVATDWPEADAFHWQRESDMGMTIIVAEDGSLLRAGADGDGAFIVRISGAP